MPSPIFRSVCGFNLKTACKILAAIHFLGSLIYIAYGAKNLAEDNSTKNVISCTILIIASILNIANALMIYYAVDERKDRILVAGYSCLSGDSLCWLNLQSCGLEGLHTDCQYHCVCSDYSSCLLCLARDKRREEQPWRELV